MSNSYIKHVIPAVYPLPAGEYKHKRESIYTPSPGFLITTFRNDTTPLFRRPNYYKSRKMSMDELKTTSYAKRIILVFHILFNLLSIWTGFMNNTGKVSNLKW